METQIRYLRIAVAAMLLLALALVALYFLLPNLPRRNPRVETQQPVDPRNCCIIVTEMTDAGRALPAPSADKQVYFMPHFVSQRDIGDVYGNAKPIPYADIQEQLARALASNGYHAVDAANPANPPAQVLFFAWGTHNGIDLALHGPDTGNAASNANFHTNLLSRAKTIGGQKFAGEYSQALSGKNMKQFTARDTITEAIDHAVWNDCHYLLVYSLDAEALSRREKKLLWTMRISTVPHGLSLAETLPVMIHTAAPFFVRETPPKIVGKKEPKAQEAKK